MSAVEDGSAGDFGQPARWWLDPPARGTWWWVPAEDFAPEHPVCAVALVGERPQQHRWVRLPEDRGWREGRMALDSAVVNTAPVLWHQVGDHPVVAAYELRDGLWVLGLNRFAGHRAGNHNGTGSGCGDALFGDFADGLVPDDEDDLPLPRRSDEQEQL